jgi:transposase-like protein
MGKKEPIRLSRPGVKLTQGGDNMQKEYVNYSEALKMQVVQEICRGKFASILEAQKAYGIRGMATIRTWLKKHGREDLLPKRVRVETMAEIDGLKEAKKRIRDLEKALSDSHMDYCLERAFLEIACEQMGTSRDELKKNSAMRLADVRRRSGMQ